MLRRRTASVALAACVLVALASCSAAEQDDALITTDVMEAYPAALLEGVAALSWVDGRACWTVSPLEGGDRYVLVLPVGSRMSDDDELRIAGTEAWLADGDDISVGGGEWHDAGYRDVVELCGATGLWLVSPGAPTG